MPTNIFLKLILFLGLGLAISPAVSSPSFEWLEESNSETRRLAKEFFANPERPTEVTRVLYHSDTQIDGDKVIERVKVIRFYPKQSHIEDRGNGTIYWDQDLQSLEIKEAGVVSADNRYQRFDPDNMRVVDDDGYNTFTDNKEVVLPFSGLREGDVSILEYHRTYKLSRLESNWSNSFYPVTLEDTLSFEISARSNSIPLNASVISERVKCDIEKYSIQCRGQNLDAFRSDSNVIWRDVIDQVYLSSVFSWETVIADSLKAFNKAELNAPEVDALLSRLTVPEQTMEEKISRIQEYVARELRYVSLSELGHRITPHTVASVDKNKFGDCKDKTAVIVALLRKLGIDANPVLVATERDDASRLRTPSAGYFDHMISCFQFDGEQYCIDGTDNDTHWRVISSWIQGSAILPLIKGSVPSTLSSAKPRWSMILNSELTFDSNGKQFEKQSRTFLDSYAGDMRSSYRPYNEEKRTEALVKNYQQWVSASVTPTFTLRDVDSLTNTFTVESSVEYEPFLDIQEDLNYTENDHWLRFELAESKLKTQHYDTEFEGLNVVSTVEFDATKIWKITRLPASLNLKGNFGNMTRIVSRASNGTVNIKTVLDLPRQMVDKSQIVAFNNYLDLLKGESSINIQGTLP